MIEIKKNNSNVILFTDDKPKFMNIPVDSLIAIYNNNEQVDEKKLKNIKEKDYFFMRSGERALVGTGLNINIPNNTALIINPEPTKATLRGLMIINSPIMIYSDNNNEIMLTLYNPTKNLLKVTKNDIVAYGTLVNIKDITLKEVNEFTKE